MVATIITAATSEEHAEGIASTKNRILCSDRFYSEDEIQLECEGKYNQEKFNQGYTDDEYNQDFPFRHITQWSLKVPREYLTNFEKHHEGFEIISHFSGTSVNGSKCVPLPENDEFLPTLDRDEDDEDDNEQEYYQHAVLEGYLLPNPNFPNLPRLPVRISSLRNVCLDTAREDGRGFWIATTASPHASLYWLQEPSEEQKPFMLQRRAQLGLFSNLLDCCGPVKDWADKTPTVLHSELVDVGRGLEPFSMDLLRSFARSLQPMILQALSPFITPRSVFYKQLLRLKKNLSPEEIEPLCLQAEARSGQHPWGGRLMTSEENTPSKNVFTQAIHQDLLASVRKIAAKRGSKRSLTVSTCESIARGAKLLRQTSRHTESRQPRIRRSNPSASSRDNDKNKTTKVSGRENSDVSQESMPSLTNSSLSK